MLIVCIHFTVITIMSCILLFLLFTVVSIIITIIADNYLALRILCKNSFSQITKVRFYSTENTSPNLILWF